MDNWVYEDAEYLKIWITFLLEATHKPYKKLIGKNIEFLERGQFVFGRKKFAERLKIKEWKLQKATELLVKDEMIKTVKRTNKYTIYEIVNYSFYQQQVQQQEMFINQGVSQIEQQQNNSKSNSKNNSNKARNIKAFTYFINSKDNNKTTAKQQQELQQEQQQQSLKYQGFEAYEQQQEHQQMFEISTHNNNNNNNNIYKYIVEYLNEKANKNFKPTTKKTQSLINARIKEGFTLDDFKKVIDTKCSQWLGTEMEKYLRPETLFGTKFEGYLNEGPKGDKPPTPDNWRRSDRRL